ncbi:hypothetical protein Tco_0413219 [Tanacetum coccineum]
MTTTAGQQVALDNALVPLEKRICPRLPTQEFDALPSDEEIRTFAAIINKCLSGKITGLDKLRLLRAQILWGMFYKKNVDFVELLWEDFTFQIENIDHKKQENIYHPRFTKSIIHHFISNDKSISIKNRMFMHTSQDDSILGPMRFVSKSEDFQVYGALLPNMMTNQQMRDSTAYKTYLIYATGAALPKMKRKFKKHASLPKKKDLVAKKAPAKAERSKGIELLSDAALLEEAQLKKVPDEPKDKSIDTSEGTSLKPGVLDVSKGDSSESEYESWGDSGDEANNQETNADEEETKDEFVHTPPNYVPTDDETNDESNDVDEEEYDRIDKELYGDVNVRLKDSKHKGKGKDGEKMTDVGRVHVVVENIDQVGADTEVIFMIDINVQHEVPHTSSLLTIPVSVIPEQIVINPSETITTASATTITSLLSSLFPSLQQTTPILTPITIEATTSTTAVPDSETFAALQLRVTGLEKDVKELKDVDNSTKKNFADIIKEHSALAETVERLRKQYTPQKSVEDIREIKMEHARKQQVLKETITLSDTTALEEFDQKTTLFETMTKSKSFNKSLKQRALYHALIESILEDEDLMDEGVAKKLKKRKQDDADKDEGPSAGSDRGLKRRKTSKDTETSKKAKSTESSKGTSKSQPKSTNKEDTGNTDEPHVVNVVPKDWFKKPERPPTLDPEWNEGNCQIVPVDYFFNNDLAYLQRGSTGRTYTTSLTKTKATKYDLPRIEDMVPNLVSKHDVYSTKRILAVTNVKVKEWYGYGHLEEIEVRRSDQQLYKFMEGDFPRLHLHDIKDMLILLVQNRLFNLKGDVIMHLAVALYNNL